ncbi:NADH-quinone oxidoreductase subunit C [Rhodoferax sediminis]|uniref:Ni,Fe-hydrogenase III large subunit n=1 Tax=Rhodoferax sediminis TaxID=2509614 RepID=A0A515D8H1_9BURK|nr:NADH-quinone oxidoreductase subunit C [Rhodoferax sediminis]QDL36708.1 Ni,Fe-hydrogenase III large subunit [Rhodoferax sediminis]
MALSDLQLDLRRLQAPLPIWHAVVHHAAWSKVARSIADAGGRLVSVWGVDRRTAGRAMVACAAYATTEGLVWVELPLGDAARSFPDLAAAFPCAGRMQRAMADLLGLHAEGSHDTRPWLDHGLWPPAPLSTPNEGRPLTVDAGALPADYPFVRVEGDGVHEIAVGPVHAGIIEPGHWRFSVVGEKVLRLEAHLGYAHKGIERRFTDLAPQDACRLAGRVSGDSTVAYAWAYCMALESAWRCETPARATWLRALMLERERVANHLGDLGGIANDAALGFGLSQFSRLREDWHRLSREVFGHRFMMDAVVPGGTATDPAPPQLIRIAQQCDAIEQEVKTLRIAYDEHAGLQDRFLAAGTVTPERAAQLGLTGLAGRASAQAFDLRCDHAWAPYDGLKVAMAAQHQGDVAARVAVRFDETLESLRLIRSICTGLPQGATRTELSATGVPAFGMGWVEGWRGEVLVALEVGADERIVRCHCHDPSWQNWPALEHAIMGNIVADFPLINKSFNLSYSGHDL